MKLCLLGIITIYFVFIRKTNAGDAEDYLLPGDIVPSHYNLKLVTYIQNFDSGEKYFDGEVEMFLKVLGNNISKVVVHAYLVNVTEAKISCISNVELPLENSSPQPDSFQKLNFHLANQTLNKDDEIVLKIKYRGYHVKSPPLGFYWGEDEGRYYLATQFAQIHARKMFPCFDEPRYRATYNMSVSISKSLPDHFVLSSTPQDGPPTIDPDNKNNILFKFKKTPIAIPTYLVAVVVSDFTPTTPAYFKSDYGNQVVHKTFTTWGTAEKINNGAGLVSQHVGPRAIEYYTKLFEIGFPFEKIDQVGVSNFHYSAMENYGLILYQDTVLSNAGVMLHELAHQWFGNLVTLHWWSDYWMKEGFANFFKYFAAAEVLEDFTTDFEGNFQLDVLLIAFPIDSYLSSAPLTNNKFKPEEMPDLASQITYNKGASVIRMLNHVLGDEIFYHGLKIYLNNGKENISVPEDLTGAFDTAIELENVNINMGNMSVGEMFYPWHIEPGYPLVTAVRISDNTLKLQQERFLIKSGLDSYKNKETIWNIPISYSTDLDTNFNETKPSSWLRSKESLINIDASTDWYIINNQQTGFYRVNYENENWERLFQVLNNSEENIHKYNRVQIIDDCWALCKSGHLNCSIPLQLSTYMKHEVNALVKKTFHDHELELINHVFEDKLFDKFKLYLVDIHKKMFADQKLDDIFSASVLCSIGYEDCVEEALNNLRNMSDLDMRQRKIVYCAGARSKGDIFWNTLYHKYLVSEDRDERKMLLSALGCSSNLNLIARLLETTIDFDSEVNIKNNVDVIDSILSVIPSGPNLDQVFRFLLENSHKMTYSVSNYKEMRKLLQITAKLSNKEKHLKQLKQLHNNIKLTSGDQIEVFNEIFHFAEEIIAGNILWQKKYKQSFFDWLLKFY